MTMRIGAGVILLTMALGGCQTVRTHTTKVNTPVIVYAYGLYNQNCEAWEPPEVSLWSPPAHGTVAHGLVKAGMKQAGSRCDGQKINYQVSVYKPAPGFRGQDKLTLKYDYLSNDIGGRATQSVDIVVDVK